MLFRSWGASIIGMTAMPEARLAREAEMCYAALALVTDFDVWHDEFESVTVDMVVANLHKNVAAAQSTIAALASSSLPERTCSCGDALGPALSTARDAIPADIRDHLGIIVDRYVHSGSRPVTPARWLPQISLRRATCGGLRRAFSWRRLSSRSSACSPSFSPERARRRGHGPMSRSVSSLSPLLPGSA